MGPMQHRGAPRPLAGSLQSAESRLGGDAGKTFRVEASDIIQVLQMLV